MDNTLAGLLQGCAESPADSTPHRILADWLEDHDQTERAELVRVQCDLADWVPDWRQRQTLLQRQDELIAEHRERWLGPLAPLVEDVRFERGLCHVVVTGKNFALTRFGKALEENASGLLVEVVRLVRCKSLARIASRPCLGRIPKLSLAGLRMGYEDIDWLLASENARNLVGLDLSNCGLGPNTVWKLAESPALGRLVALSLRNNDLTDEDVNRLLTSAGPSLVDFDVALNTLRTPTTVRLSPRMPVSRIMNSLGMEFVRVPAGSFLMGSPTDERGELSDEHPQHPVQISRPFWMGRFAVTQQQYYDVMINRPSSFHGVHRPVENVSWHNAIDFCRYLGQLRPEVEAGRRYRLATEAEWEHACRGGTFTAFHTGPTHSMEWMNCQTRFDNTESDRILLNRTADVGSYPANGFGLYEMHGNVWEWCSDWYDKDAYGHRERVDPRGPARGTERAMRGGCWEALGRWCRSAKRLGDNPENTDRLTGFRVVVEFAETR